MKTTIAFLGFILMITGCTKNALPGQQKDKSPTQILVSNAKTGTQKWASANLSVSRYRNGDIIPQVRDASAWAALTTGAWCYYNNDPANEPIYGKLYNWYAVNDPRGLAPKGWRIPSTIDWNKLLTTLGDSAEKKLKSASGW